MMQRYPAYKDSLFDWLGEIPGHWEEKRAKWYFDKIDERSETGDEELLSVSHITGITPRSEKNVTMFQAESYEGHKLCQPGDLVINNMWAWMAALGVSRYAGIVSSAYGVYRPKRKDLFNSQYLDYLMRLKGYAGEYLCRSKGVWTSRLLLNPDAFFNIPIVHPPLEEQDEIVAFLEEQTAVINQFLANKRKLITLLEEQKQVVINTAVTQGLDPNAPRKPSGIDWLGDIPAHWEIKKLKYVAEVQTGLTLGQKYPNVPLIERPYLRVANVQDGYLDLAEITTIQLPVDKAVRYELEMGDVLMTEGGDFDKLGRGFIWEGQIDNCLHQNHIFAVRPNKEILKPYFLTAIMSSLHGKEYFIESSKQTTNLASINSTKLKRFPILIPTLKEQQDILDYLEQKTAVINTAIRRIQREIELIEEYRTTLIAHAVTGKIDVRPQPEMA
jgi:type I restriction enzyme S subunit